MTAEIVMQDLQKLEDIEKKKILQRFFKTGIGEYGEGDVFLGITVPKQRIVAAKHKDLELKDIQKLLDSKVHEHRLTGLFILVSKFKKTKDKAIVDFYIRNAKKVNNWDLVDSSADSILGDYLFDKDKSVLISLAKSTNLWERRISIISTYSFIKKGDAEWTFKISEILINDKEDLIQKAVGWMLREVGKRVSEEKEEIFLKRYYKKMPRTMLRYAIERFDDKKRKFYMS